MWLERWLLKVSGRYSSTDMVHLGLFLLGLATAGAWAIYIAAVDDKHAYTAAAADLFILLSGSVSVQLWANRRRDFWLLAAFDVGAVLGTFLTVHFSH